MNFRNITHNHNKLLIVSRFLWNSITAIEKASPDGKTFCRKNRRVARPCRTPATYSCNMILFPCSWTEKKKQSDKNYLRRRNAARDKNKMIFIADRYRQKRSLTTRTYSEKREKRERAPPRGYFDGPIFWHDFDLCQLY